MGVAKLVIKVYGDSDFGAEKGEFVSTINPKDLKIYNEIEYSDSQTFGNPNWTLQYNISRPKILSFSLLFDNTGIFFNSNIDVKQQVKSLESLIFSYQEDINEPFYVRVIWGSIDFKGKLLKMQTNYSMFKNDGSPIRAQTDISIIEFKQEIIEPESQKEITSDDQNNNDHDTNEKDPNNPKNDQAENKKKDDPGEQDADNNRSDTQNTVEETKEKENQNKDKEKEEEENINDKKENDEDTENGNQQDNNKKKEQNKPTTNNNKNNPTNPAVTSNTIKAGDSLPAMTNNILKNPPYLNNMLAKVAAFNGLNTLRALIAGAALLIPLTVAGLLALLLQKLLALLKRGVTFIKNKAKAGAKKVQNGAKSLANKAKNGANKTQNGGNKIWNKMKSGAKNVGNKAKAGFNKVKSKVR